MRLDVKWATRQRLQYIEIMAWYAGVVTRSDVARAFGLSDPAATKDLKLYGDLAPGNLVYNHSVFGFVPGAGFAAVFADLTPAAVLPIIAANLAEASGPYGGEPVYGLATASLPLPARLPGPQTLAQITRAMLWPAQATSQLPLTVPARERCGAHSRAPHPGQYRTALACAGV